MYSHRLFVVIIIATFIMCFGKSANASGAMSPDKKLTAACANASDEEKYKIEFGTEDGAPKIYVCSITGGDSIFGGDCYFPTEPVSLFIKSDLNKDGMQDAIIGNYMRGGSMDDIKGYVGFANCGKNVYLRFTIGDFSDMVQLKNKQTGRWPDFRVTRECYNKDENRPRLQTRTFTIKFDEKSFKYSPPNNDPELMYSCSEKEYISSFESERDL